jgi:hypothetical protein
MARLTLRVSSKYALKMTGKSALPQMNLYLLDLQCDKMPFLGM